MISLAFCTRIPILFAYHYPIITFPKDWGVLLIIHFEFKHATSSHYHRIWTITIGADGRVRTNFPPPDGLTKLNGIVMRPPTPIEPKRSEFIVKDTANLTLW